MLPGSADSDPPRSSPPTERTSLYPDARRSGVSARMTPIPEDHFLPDTTLQAWTRAAVLTREGSRLLIDGRRFATVDGLRVLGRRNGESDPFGLTGRIMSLRALLARSAIVSGNGVRIGAVIYDVELGTIIEPLD